MLKPIVIWDPDRQASIDEMANNIDKVTKIVILAHLEATIDQIPESQISKILNLSFRNKIPLCILVSGHEDNPNILNDIRSKYTTIIRWPLYWLTETLIRHTWHSNYSENIKLGYDLYNLIKPANYDYTFIALNKRPRMHRLIMMDFLAKHNLIKTNVISYRERLEIKEQLQYWEQEIINLDQTDDSKLFEQELLPPQYGRSFMQLVTETEENIFFLTEKTAIPLFFKKPFLVASCRYFHRKLEDLGFQLYTELFDYDFDSIYDVRSRFELLVENIKRLDNLPKDELPLLYEKIEKKIVYNRNHAMKIACDTSSFPKVWLDLAATPTNLSTVNPYDTLLRLQQITKY